MIHNSYLQNAVWRFGMSQINKDEWDKFFKLFDAFHKGKLLKGYTYTAVKKNAKRGKDLFKSMTYRDGGVIQGLVNKSFLKQGFEKSPSYFITNRNKYLDGDELISSVYNKRKFKGKKSGFHYKGGLKYADKFIYKRFGSPVDKFKSKIKDDYDKGISLAIKDAMKKGGFD